MRTRTTLYLIGSFCLFLYMGHVPLMGMILGIQASCHLAGTWIRAPGQVCESCLLQYLMVRELYALADRAHRHKQRDLGDKRKAPQWYFFFVATFWMYFR